MKPEQTPNPPARKPLRVRPFFRALIALPAGFFVIAASQVVASQVANQYFRGEIQKLLFVFYILVNPALLALTWFLLKHLDRKNFRNFGLWFYPGWGREVWLGVAIGATLIAVCVGTVLPGPWLDYTGVSPTFDAGRFVFIGVFLILAAALEEIIFRGYIFQRLVDSIGPLGAMLLLSAFFGVAHLDNPSATALSTANTILAGILLAVAYLKTRGLWLPIALHWAWNFFLGPVFSLPISGFRIGPTLFTANVSGPDWLSGGDYGLEGSVVLTVACTAAIVWLWMTEKVRATPVMAELSKDPEQA